MEACKDHLESEQKDIDGNHTKYYSQVSSKDVDVAKFKISKLIEEGLDNDFITKSDYEAMNPIAKNVGRFYCNFKIHQPHEENTAPPVRPIVSGSGSITENIGKFVQHHLNP